MLLAGLGQQQTVHRVGTQISLYTTAKHRKSGQESNQLGPKQTTIYKIVQRCNSNWTQMQTPLPLNGTAHAFQA